jgi:hypothetical protein
MLIASKLEQRAPVRDFVLDAQTRFNRILQWDQRSGDVGRHRAFQLPPVVATTKRVPHMPDKCPESEDNADECRVDGGAIAMHTTRGSN